MRTIKPEASSHVIAVVGIPERRDASQEKEAQGSCPHNPEHVQLSPRTFGSEIYRDQSTVVSHLKHYFAM